VEDDIVQNCLTDFTVDVYFKSGVTVVIDLLTDTMQYNTNCISSALRLHLQPTEGALHSSVYILVLEFSSK